VPAVIDDLGTAICVQAGGGVHGHPDGTRAGAEALRAAVEAAAAGEPLEERAEAVPALAAALERWGRERPR
jgi:ribulose-bisphosphate carboxylase large chain